MNTLGLHSITNVKNNPLSVDHVCYQTLFYTRGNFRGCIGILVWFLKLLHVNKDTLNNNGPIKGSALL